MKKLMFLILAVASALANCEEEDSKPKLHTVVPFTLPGCEMCRADSSALSSVTETKWLEYSDRKKAFTKNYVIVTQNGKRLRFDDLCDRPVALTFLYTRCDNPNKCPLAAATFAKLAQEVRNAGFDKKVRLVVMTYDPEFDSPEVLSRYAQEKKIECNESVMLLQPDPATKKELFEELNVSVNYNANRVNIHGLQIILLDKHARYVRSYHTLIWENAKVIADLKRLIAED